MFETALSFGINLQRIEVIVKAVGGYIQHLSGTWIQSGVGSLPFSNTRPPLG